METIFENLHDLVDLANFFSGKGNLEGTVRVCRSIHSLAKANRSLLKAKWDNKSPGEISERVWEYMDDGEIADSLEDWIKDYTPGSKVYKQLEVTASANFSE